MKVLQTERLTLRWFGEPDAAFVLELLNDPSWINNIGDRGVRTLDDARKWIDEKLVASYWQKGLGLWAVERRSDGELVGMCGLLERDSLPAIDVGYALAPRFWGNGYAREATAACLSYAREVLDRHRILAIVQPENQPSIRVLESVGMTRAGAHRLEGESKELALFAVGADVPAEPRAELDALIRRFFAAFSNRDGLSRIASVPSMFLPDAVVTIVRDGVETLGVREFVAPRAALLLGDRLAGFHEREVSADTQIVGALAQRTTRYEKAGTLDGQPYAGAGNKLFQFIRTARGWKIAALAWQDD